MMRRLKKDHLDGLPDKTECVFRDPMPSVQEECYLTELNEARSLRSNQNRKGWMLKTLARIRDISAHPYLILHDPCSLEETPVDELIFASARLIRAVKILEDIRRKDEKAVIFILNRTFQRVVRRILAEKFRLEADIVNGSTPTFSTRENRTRRAIVKNFQTATGSMFLFSLQRLPG